jgi:hypothetical protein
MICPRSSISLARLIVYIGRMLSKFLRSTLVTTEWSQNHHQAPLDDIEHDQFVPMLLLSPLGMMASFLHDRLDDVSSQTPGSSPEHV